MKEIISANSNGSLTTNVGELINKAQAITEKVTLKRTKGCSVENRASSKKEGKTG